jgi:GMP synthase (glutamine-hydrolysing)
MFENVHFLLMQVRNADDPMRDHEVQSFARVLETSIDRIRTFDLLTEELSANHFEQTDMFLFGGSGHYSAAGEGDWLERALATIRQVHDSGKPAFASCWGFQAMARAMGGRVIKDMACAEVGTHELTLTEAGLADPVFGPLGATFLGQMGHEDHVIELPPHVTLLASSPLVTNQAYRFDDAPIYCTQFHPELNCDDLWMRVKTYPEYIERIAGLPHERFGELVQESTASEGVLKRFVALCFGEDNGDGNREGV